MKSGTAFGVFCLLACVAARREGYLEESEYFQSRDGNKEQSRLTLDLIGGPDKYIDFSNVTNPFNETLLREDFQSRDSGSNEDIDFTNVTNPFNETLLRENGAFDFKYENGDGLESGTEAFDSGLENEFNEESNQISTRRLGCSTSTTPVYFVYGNNAVITPVSYGSYYYDNMRCYWRFFTLSGRRLQLYCYYLKTIGNDALIVNGEWFRGLQGRFTLTSRSNVMVVQFYSDSSMRWQGFYCLVRQI